MTCKNIVGNTGGHTREEFRRVTKSACRNRVGDDGGQVRDVISLLYTTGSETPWPFSTRTSTRNVAVYKAASETRFVLIPANEPARHGERQWENQFTSPNDFSDSVWITEGLGNPTKSVVGGEDRITWASGVGNLRHAQTVEVTADNIFTVTFKVRLVSGAEEAKWTLNIRDGNTSTELLTSTARTLLVGEETVLSFSGTFGSSTQELLTSYIRYIGTGSPVLAVIEAQMENQTSLAVADKGIPNEFATDIGWSIFDNSNTAVTSNVVTFAQGVLIPEADRFGWDQEPEATNGIGESRDLTHANYTATNMTVAFDADGVNGLPNTGSTLTATAANATVIYIPVTAASGDHATKWFLTRKTGTGAVELTLDNGTTWQDVTAQVGSTMGEAIAFQAAVTNPQIGIRLVASGDAVYVAQDELHTNTTISELQNVAPIPYGGGTPFTKAADLLADATLGARFPQNAGACLVEWRSGADSADMPVVNTAMISLGASANNVLYHTGASISPFRTNDGSSIVTMPLTPFTALIKNSVACYWGGALGMVVGAVEGDSSAYDGAFGSDGIFRASFAQTHKVWWKSIRILAPQPSNAHIIGQQS